MEKFKEDIYNLWSEKKPVTLNSFDPESFKKKLAMYQEQIILPLFPANKLTRVLDIGCGYGLFLAACKEAGYKNVFGIESVPAAVTFARERLQLFGVERGEIMDFLQSLRN